jgi:hypothetical protein
LFPGRKKEWVSHCENSTKKNKWLTRAKKKMECCTNRVRVPNLLLLSCKFQSEIYVKKIFKVNVVALGVYTAKLAMKSKRGVREKATGTMYSPDV